MGRDQKFWSTFEKILVREKNPEFGKNLGKRLFDFSVNTIRFLSTISTKNEYLVFKFQLSRSSTSIGANFEEAQSAFT